jgi:beta-lactam-binding protein with PASTA domain/Ca2+-binding RTX toxin-like protein
MSGSKLFSCRRSRAAKRWAVAIALAMSLPTAGGPLFVPEVHAQTAPVGNGFSINAEDVRFIFHQIQVAQFHAAGNPLLGPGPFQVNGVGNPAGNPQLPVGLRTVDGSFNNLVPVPDQHLFGAADLLFPRVTTAVFRDAEAGTSYKQVVAPNVVIDSQPRIISNLIVDQTANNPAAAAAAANPCGSGGFVCSGSTAPDPVSGALFIPNITPDFGLSAPFNVMFAFFGQFFDHGLDLVTKGGGTVIMPLQPDDPLFVAGSPTNFMVITRGQNQPGPDGILGTADDIQEGTNTTTPWVDQNQTYTSHPSHQVFLRQYVLDAAGRPLPDGKVLDGDHCAPRGTGFVGDDICNIGNWAQVKAQAATKLGIKLVDQDVFDVPLIVTDPYGHFKPGAHGFPQMVRPGNVLVEGNPAGGGVPVPADAFRTGHAFLNDIAHNAVPSPGLLPDADAIIQDFRVTPQPAGTYDDELLNAHFVTGDGRGNENIALTMVHNLFHAEHNRLVHYIDNVINTQLTPAEIAAWHAVDPGSGWGYGERLFQAARFGTEMQYQHLVFEEFARKIQPLINPFLGGITSINGAISAEFAHTVYRLGHSMLPEIVGRTNDDGSVNNIRLFDAFLAPQKYNDGGAAGPLTAAQAAGSIIRGTTTQVANELDEFITQSVRETLVGLPLDLAAINIARGRSEGIAPLNEVRRQLFAQTNDTSLQPYANWMEFGLQLKHFESLTNFLAAYGTHPSITGATTVAAKRSAAQALVDANDPILFAPAATSGLNQVDFWNGGLAEKQSVFGGLLGSTFNFIFEHQLESLQNGDRFYYLQRTDGLNIRLSLEGNSLAELARRNTTLGGTMDNIFDTADFIFTAGSPQLTSAAPVILDPTVPAASSPKILTLGDGTKLFFDPLHQGKNILFNGGPGADRFRSDVGDDTLFGNDGNDRLDGGEGNDTLIGGDGDDVLFGQAGDDVLKGGPGNDALSTGPGFGGDIASGGDGNDFMLGGDDGVEYFGGPGNDIIVDGAQRAEGMFAGPGDDWIYDGDGHDGGMFGDNGNVFDLLAGLDPVGGDDVEGGGPGQDNHWGEGGNDIFLMSEGSNKFFGDFGWDMITLQNWPAPEFVELGLLAAPGAVLNFNDLRNRYRFVDGASGWDLDDHIAGSDFQLCDPAAAEVAECLLVGMELTQAYANKVTGLEALINAFGKSLLDPAVPGVKGVGFMGGELLMGGRGSDLLEGKGGDDLIDGDVWLHVALKATLNDGTVKVVDDPRLLVDDVFSDPQRLNPGNITIVREIITPPTPPPDCGVVHPLNCDTAVFSNPRAEYDIALNANGTVTVTDTDLTAGAHLNTGVDTLRNIEMLQFADMTIPVPRPFATVPGIVGLTEAAARAAIIAANLTVGVVTTGTSPAVLIGQVISSTPRPGVTLPPGSAVNFVVSLGTPVPLITGGTEAAAVNSIIEAGLVVGTVTTVVDPTVVAGTIVAQSPAAALNVQPGTAVNYTKSTGGSLVPSVLNFVQAVAASTITSAGLVVGTVTFAAHANVPAGSVISQTPASGTVVPTGSAVNLVVSTGQPLTIAATVTRNSSNNLVRSITSPAIVPGANTLLVAFVSADAPPAGVGPNTVVNTITNTGAALTWTRAVRSNVQLGTAEIWWAFTTPAHASMTVTANLNNPEAASLTVMAFTGAASSLVGAASGAFNAASGAPTGSVVTTRNDSIVVGVGTDWDAPRVMAPFTGQVMVNQFNPTQGDTYWVQRTNSIPAAGTRITINDTYGTTMPDRWNLAVIEIRRP